jgi:hypothetical protein
MSQVLLLLLLMLVQSASYASPDYTRISGARVVLRVPGTEGGDFVGKNVSNSDGRFHLGGVLFNWTYRINARADGFTNGSLLVPLRGGVNIPGIDVRMNRSAILTGFVYGGNGKPVSGALVCAIRDIFGCVGRDISSSDGRYVIDTNLTSGAYTIRVDPGISQEFSTLSYPTFGPWISNVSRLGQFGPNSVLGSTSKVLSNISLVAGETKNLDISLNPSGAVEGRIGYSDGRPISGAEVLISRRTTLSRILQTTLTPFSENMHLRIRVDCS